MLIVLPHKIINFSSVTYIEKTDLGYSFRFSPSEFIDTDLDEEDIQNLLTAYQSGQKLFYPHDKQNIDVSDFPSVLEGENTGAV